MATVQVETGKITQALIQLKEQGISKQSTFNQAGNQKGYQPKISKLSTNRLFSPRSYTGSR